MNKLISLIFFLLVPSWAIASEWTYHYLIHVSSFPVAKLRGAKISDLLELSPGNVAQKRTQSVANYRPKYLELIVTPSSTEKTFLDEFVDCGAIILIKRWRYVFSERNGGLRRDVETENFNRLPPDIFFDAEISTPN